MSNESEDVLASIRRLLLDEVEFSDGAHELSALDDIAGDGGGRFVLTPELRVGGGAGGADAPEESPVPFDEAALRALVTRILREELAGALGERMTGRIRKLVRAEVNRVLAAQRID